MAEANPLNAALNAFQKREQRFVLTGASIAYVVCSFVLAGALLALAWPHVLEVAQWYMQVLGAISEGREPTEPPLGALMALAPWYGAFWLFGLVLFAAYEAACLRWMARGERGGLFGLSLGADTWRVVLTYFVWIGLFLVTTAAIAAFYVLMSALTQAAPVLRIPAMVIGALSPLGFVALVIWFGVRLSPAAAASIARRRFAFFSAWGDTRGRFWELLGAFVIVFVGYIVIAMVLQTLIRIPLTSAMYPLMTHAMEGADAQALLAEAKEVFFTPLFAALGALYVIVSTALALVLYVAWFGVNARAVIDAQAAAGQHQPVSTGA